MPTTLCAAIALLRQHRATIRYLPRHRSWRVCVVRRDGTMMLEVHPSISAAVAALHRAVA